MTQQHDRIHEISDRLTEIANSYRQLVNNLPHDASPELLSIIEMSGNLTLDSLKRSATLLEVVRLSQIPERQQQAFHDYWPRRFVTCNF